MIDEQPEKPEALDDITWERVLEARNIKIANETELKNQMARVNELLKVGKQCAAEYLLRLF